MQALPLRILFLKKGIPSTIISFAFFIALPISVYMHLQIDSINVFLLMTLLVGLSIARMELKQ